MSTGKCEMCWNLEPLTDGLCETCYKYHIHSTTCGRCGKKLVEADGNDFIKSREKMMFVCGECIEEIFSK